MILRTYLQFVFHGILVQRKGSRKCLVIVIGYRVPVAMAGGSLRHRETQCNPSQQNEIKNFSKQRNRRLARFFSLFSSPVSGIISKTYKTQFIFHLSWSLTRTSKPRDEI